MNIERMERLALAVENTPDEKFDMSNWQLKSPCGTIGCAVGSYIASNPDCGLLIAFDNEVFREIGNVVTPSKDVLPFAFIASHFGISESDSDYLFDRKSYSVPSRKFVLERVRGFIKKSKR